MSDSVSNSATFVLVFLLAVVLLIAGRRILKAAMRPIRRLLALLIRALRRILRVFGRGAARGSSQRARLGVAPLTALLHVLELNSSARIGLGAVPKALEEKVHREGAFFRAVNADRAVEEVSDSLTQEDAARNVQLSDQYYAGIMNYDVSPSILYEESEEELLINIFKDSDLAFFYVLRRIKKNVGRNIIHIVTMLTGMMLVFPFVASLAIFFWKDDRGWTGMNATFYAVLCVSFFLVMVLFRWAYSNSTIKNGLHFNYFVSTYFSRLANQYKSAAAEFANVLNDRTLALDTVEAESNMWFLNLQWLAARQWFLELYVRNIMFQIGRNMWWYTLVILAGALGLLWFMVFGLGAVLQMLPLHLGDGIQPRVYWGYETIMPAAVLLIVYLASLGGLLARFWRQLGSAGWLDFRRMDIKEVVEKTVGALVREVVDKRRNPSGWGPSAPR
ncbi:MAG TPA: hypothetical protein VGF56_09765 [Rhizomicrobium sp.]|jgi:hypothetical protein